MRRSKRAARPAAERSCSLRGNTSPHPFTCAAYPKDYSPRSLGVRPASGFYVRHVKNLTFKNVQFAFEVEDQRPPLVVEDVDGFVIEGFKTTKAAEAPTARWSKVKRLSIRNAQGLKSREEVEPNAED